ncbi:hypothetical protein LXL04_018205 [Taraxacum kok-saghyz]
MPGYHEIQIIGIIQQGTNLDYDTNLNFRTSNLYTTRNTVSIVAASHSIIVDFSQPLLYHRRLQPTLPLSSSIPATYTPIIVDSGTLHPIIVDYSNLHPHHLSFTPSRTQLLQAIETIRDLMAGAMMGGMVHTVVAPIERVKLLLQTQESNIAIVGGKHRRFNGMIDCIVHTVKNEGVLPFSLWIWKERRVYVTF